MKKGKKIHPQIQQTFHNSFWVLLPSQILIKFVNKFKRILKDLVSFFQFFNNKNLLFINSFNKICKSLHKFFNLVFLLEVSCVQ